MVGSLTTKIINKRTGRSGYHTIKDRPTAHPAVQSFVGKLCSDPKTPLFYWWYWILISNRLAWKLYKQINTVALRGINGTYYRARYFPLDAAKPTSSELGPPPVGGQREGRYTHGKGVVLYLSRTPKTAALEISADTSTQRIFIQKFELSIPDAKVVCLSKDLEERYRELHYLLLDSEYLPGEHGFVPNPYRATQFIAFISQLQRVFAIEYPSVRGHFGENPNAVNLVLLAKLVDRASLQAVGDPFEIQTS